LLHTTFDLQGSTNIGIIKGGNYHFVGGIAGYLDSNVKMAACINSGIVEGSHLNGGMVGGIVGYVDREA